MITETFSSEFKTPLKKPTLYQQSSGGGGGGGVETNKQNPQNPNNVSHTQRWLLVESTWSAARKNYLLPALFKILLVTKSSSVHRPPTTRTSLFHKPILNTDEDHPISSTKEDIHKQQ